MEALTAGAASAGATRRARAAKANEKRMMDVGGSESRVHKRECARERVRVLVVICKAAAGPLDGPP